MPVGNHKIQQLCEIQNGNNEPVEIGAGNTTRGETMAVMEFLSLVQQDIGDMWQMCYACFPYSAANHEAHMHIQG